MDSAEALKTAVFQIKLSKNKYPDQIIKKINIPDPWKKDGWEQKPEKSPFLLFFNFNPSPLVLFALRAKHYPGREI